MESMKDRVMRLYKQGDLNLGGLIRAVDKGLITEESFFNLTNKTVKNARQEAFPEIYKRDDQEVEANAE